MAGDTARVQALDAIQAQDLPLRIIAGEPMPLYLQIVHQLKQLIMTGELADGIQLPAVRPLATHLGVNPGTVMQAYRELANEGLTASMRGRGSVVRNLSGRSDDVMTRERVLDAEVSRLVVRARALGFDPAQTQQRVSAALLSSREPVPVVFLGVTQAHARRYTEELNEHFGDSGVVFLPWSMDDILRRDAGLLAELELAYTVIAFAPRVPEVERALDEWGVPVELIGVRAELAPASRRALAQREPDRSYVLITEPRAVTTALALLETQGEEHGPIEVLACDEDGDVDRARLEEILHGESVIIYSFGVRDVIAGLSVPDERLLEIRFEFSESTWRELRRRWGQGAAKEGAAQ